MALTDWITNNNSIIQGDIVVKLERGRVYKDYIELYLYAYSQKWDKCNVALEYKNSDISKWNKDMSITSASADYIKDNKIYGLTCSSSGYKNKITWKYSDNYVKTGETPKVRTRILPSVKIFSKGDSKNLITSVYGTNKVDVIDSSSFTILGINNDGNYIGTFGEELYILSASDWSVLYTYAGVQTPKHAIQIYSNRYLVADTGNNRVIELSEDLSTVINSYSVTDPYFVDYSEYAESVLITSRSSNTIYEIGWRGTVGTKIWTSTCSLLNPSCATYSRKNLDKIWIADTGNNRIISYDRIANTYEYRNYNLQSQAGKGITIYKPFRVYQLYDDKICIVEQSGENIGWDSAESSSSSSIDSSSSSSYGGIGFMAIGVDFIVF